MQIAGHVAPRAQARTGFCIAKRTENGFGGDARALSVDLASAETSEIGDAWVQFQRSEVGLALAFELRARFPRAASASPDDGGNWTAAAHPQRRAPIANNPAYH